MSYTLNISTNKGQDYIVLKNGVQVYDGDPFTKFDTIVIPWNQPSNYVSINGVEYPLEAYVGDMTVDSSKDDDISIYFRKTGGIIG